MPTRSARAERWFPIYVRYVGLVLGTALVTATILGYADPIKYAGAYTFVTFLILYKTVNDYTPGGSRDRGDRSD